MPTAQIYIKREKEATWKKFKKVCKANDWKISEKIMEYVQTMAEAHGDGGSQTYLEYAENPKTLPLFMTCKHSQKEKHHGEFYCRHDAYWHPPSICDDCDFYQSS